MMQACGLVVEYNPFHNGHLHHLNKAKQVSGANCVIAVMSGPFLQRGEPAIIDKFHRAKAAIAAGVDIVIELPYSYAVQHSNLFADGALQSLAHLKVDSVCFGSESGDIATFTDTLQYKKTHWAAYEKNLKRFLKQGNSFPRASSRAYEAIGLNQRQMTKPNNILGLSYVEAIDYRELPIEPLTIERINNNYHDHTISNSIASATSIRREIDLHDLSDTVQSTMPETTLEALRDYFQTASQWHHWEQYFPFIQYQVMTKSPDELQQIHGMDEGLEYRLKQTCREATSFSGWMQLIQTKRYTRTRIQRMFVHLLTNTSKEDIRAIHQLPNVPYIRLLGMSAIGRTYLQQTKKKIDVPVFTGLNRKNQDLLNLDEKASATYYHVLPVAKRWALWRQEFQLPIMTAL